MIQVLFVDDEPRILDGLKRVMRARRGEWDMTFALGGAAALEALSRTPYQIVFSDMRMPEMDGVALLARLRVQHPSVLRVLLSGQTDIEAGVLAASVAHQFLTKPCDQTTIADRVDVAERLQVLLTDPELRAFAGGVNALPCLDETRLALASCIADAAAAPRDVASVVEGDIALTTKLVQLAGSSFFAPPRRIASVGDAVERLGLDVVRALVQSGALFAAEPFAPRDGFSLAALNQAAAHAGRDARARCADPTQAGEAYLRAMVTYVGPLLLGTRTDASHDEVALAHVAGAYLLGLWGLPTEFVELAARGASGGGDHSAGPGSWRRAA